MSLSVGELTSGIKFDVSGAIVGLQLFSDAADAAVKANDRLTAAAKEQAKWLKEQSENAEGAAKKFDDMHEAALRINAEISKNVASVALKAQEDAASKTTQKFDDIHETALRMNDAHDTAAKKAETLHARMELLGRVTQSLSRDVDTLGGQLSATLLQGINDIAGVVSALSVGGLTGALTVVSVGIGLLAKAWNYVEEAAEKAAKAQREASIAQREGIDRTTEALNRQRKQITESENEQVRLNAISVKMTATKLRAEAAFEEANAPRIERGMGVDERGLIFAEQKKIADAAKKTRAEADKLDAESRVVMAQYEAARLILTNKEAAHAQAANDKDSYDQRVQEYERFLQRLKSAGDPSASISGVLKTKPLVDESLHQQFMESMNKALSESTPAKATNEITGFQQAIQTQLLLREHFEGVATATEETREALAKFGLEVTDTTTISGQFAAALRGKDTRAIGGDWADTLTAQISAGLKSGIAGVDFTQVLAAGMTGVAVRFGDTMAKAAGGLSSGLGAAVGLLSTAVVGYTGVIASAGTAASNAFAGIADEFKARAEAVSDALQEFIGVVQGVASRTANMVISKTFGGMKDGDAFGAMKETASGFTGIAASAGGVVAALTSLAGFIELLFISDPRSLLLQFIATLNPINHLIATPFVLLGGLVGGLAVTMGTLAAGATILGVGVFHLSTQTKSYQQVQEVLGKTAGLVVGALEPMWRAFLPATYVVYKTTEAFIAAFGALSNFTMAGQLAFQAMRTFGLGAINAAIGLAHFHNGMARVVSTIMVWVSDFERMRPGGSAEAADRIYEEAAIIGGQTADVDALMQSRQALIDFTYDGTMVATEALLELAGATESALNVPEGYKVAKARFDAMDAETERTASGGLFGGSASEPHSGLGNIGSRNPWSNPLTGGGNVVNIVIERMETSDPRGFVEQVISAFQRRGWETTGAFAGFGLPPRWTG